MSENNIARMPANGQRHTCCFEMKLRFKLSFRFKGIDSFMGQYGFSEGIVANNAATVYMSQTVPFIPDDELLKKYADVIKEKYLQNNSRFEVCKCVFDGYEYLYAVNLGKHMMPVQKDPDMDELMQLVADGIKNEVISFITDPNMESGTVCFIGGYWFYFSYEKPNPSPAETPAALYDKYVREGLIDTKSVIKCIAEAIDDLKDNDRPEYDYYICCLTESREKERNTDA